MLKTIIQHRFTRSTWNTVVRLRHGSSGDQNGKVKVTGHELLGDLSTGSFLCQSAGANRDKRRPSTPVRDRGRVPLVGDVASVKSDTADLTNLT